VAILVFVCTGNHLRTINLYSKPTQNLLWPSLSAGQLPREMYSRLMLSVSGVCESC